MDATIECLVEYGYAGTTTGRIAERAGLSRGAPMHHYQRKAPLVAAALLHLAAKRRRELIDRARVDLPRGGATIPTAIEILWATFSGPLFTAALELWIAARTDPELREALTPVEREITEGARKTAHRFYTEAGLDDEEVAARINPAVEMVTNTMRGMALQQILDPSPARMERQLSFLKELMTIYLTATDRERPIP